jgi:hypothetical protein
MDWILMFKVSVFTNVFLMEPDSILLYNKKNGKIIVQFRFLVCSNILQKLHKAQPELCYLHPKSRDVLRK